MYTTLTRIIATICCLLVIGFFSASIGWGQDSLHLVGTAVGEVSGDQFGVSVAGAGDVNNDGLQDVLIGASANDDGGSASGKAYLYLGGTSFDLVSDLSFVGVSGDFLGASVAGVGDVNNDGFDDILVGGPFSSSSGSNSGKALLFLGGDPMDNTPDVTFYGEASLDQFGAAVSGLGDVNNDGYADWAIGAFKADSGSQENIGKVYVYFGSASPDSVKDLVIIGKADGERFGYAIGGCGKFNDDAYDDFIVGAYSYDSPTQVNVGRAYVFYGGSTPDTIPDLVVTGENPHDFFGYAVNGAGDVDGDGYDDIIVGAKGFDNGTFLDAGKSYVYFGGVAPDAIADFSVATTRTNDDEFGYAVGTAGELNGDGLSEFLIGAPGDNEVSTGAGKTYLYNGGTVPFPLDTTMTGEGMNAQFGHALGSLGKIANDLYGAFCVGALGNNGSTGKIYIYATQDTGGTANQAPVLDPIGSKGVIEGNHLEFRVTASDPDGTTPELRVENEPAGASFVDSLNGAGGFFYDPAVGDTGQYDVRFIASDGVAAGTEVVPITVISADCNCPKQGDMNNDNVLDAVDLNLIILVLFFNGSDPQDPQCPITRSDINADSISDAVDLNLFILTLFFNGSPPVDPCAP